MNLHRLLDLMSGYWPARALLTAVELDLFTHIDRGGTSLEDLCRTTGASRRGLESLLPVLQSMDLVEEGPKGYVLLPAGHLLSSVRPDHRLGIFWHHINLWNKWNRLTESILSGKPTEGEFDLESFILAMAHNKTEESEVYLGALDLTGVRTVLDLGGGPGSFSLAFLELLPEAKVTLFDLPEVIELASTILPKEKIEDGAISLMGGDFREDSLGSGYDLIWVSSILHSYGLEDSRLLVEKAHAALSSGGRLVIRDFYLRADRSGPLFPALFSLNMLVNTDEGRAYTGAEIQSLMEEAGFTSIRILSSAGESQMVVGTRT